MKNTNGDTRLVQVRLPRALALGLKIEAAQRDSSMQELLSEMARSLVSDRTLKLAERQIHLDTV